MIATTKLKLSKSQFHIFSQLKKNKKPCQPRKMQKIFLSCKYRKTTCAFSPSVKMVPLSKSVNTQVALTHPATQKPKITTSDDEQSPTLVNNF